MASDWKKWQASGAAAQPKTAAHGKRLRCIRGAKAACAAILAKGRRPGYTVSGAPAVTVRWERHRQRQAALQRDSVALPSMTTNNDAITINAGGALSPTGDGIVLGDIDAIDTGRI